MSNHNTQLTDISRFFEDRCNSDDMIYTEKIDIELLMKKFAICSEIAEDLYSHAKAGQLPFLNKHKVFFDSLPLEEWLGEDLCIDANLEDIKYEEIVSYFKDEIHSYRDIDKENFASFGKSLNEIPHPLFLEITKSFFNSKKSILDYYHGQNLIREALGISYQLFVIRFIYSLIPSLKMISLSDLLWIDYAAMNLLSESNNYIGSFYDQGKHRNRTLISKRKKADKKEKRKQPVLEEYYKIPDRENKTLHKIATIIHERLSKNQQSPLSISSIKRYLKEENLF